MAKVHPCRHAAHFCEQAARFRFSVRDRVGQNAGSFNARSSSAVMTDAGIAVVKIPPRCPCGTCYAERRALTARTELADRMPIFGERQLRRAAAASAAHYNPGSPHRAPRWMRRGRGRPSPGLRQNPVSTDPRRAARRRRTRGLNRWSPAMAGSGPDAPQTVWKILRTRDPTPRPPRSGPTWRSSCPRRRTRSCCACTQEVEHRGGEQRRSGEHRDVPLTGHRDHLRTRQRRGERRGRRGQAG